MAAGDQAPPMLARRAHKPDQVGITAGGARRMHAVRGIPFAAAEEEDEEERARCSVSIPFIPRHRRDIGS